MSQLVIFLGIKYKQSFYFKFFKSLKMKALNTNHNFKQFEDSVKAFEFLLENEPKFDKKADFLHFFSQHPTLVLAMSGFVSMSYMSIDALEFQFQLSQNSICDAAFGSSKQNAYCLIKLGNSDRNTLFNNEGVFSTQFEHNYGQISNWLYEIDKIKHLSSETTPRFASENPNIAVLLVIGRSKFLTQDEKDRLRWRTEKTWINSQNIECVTYDTLLAHFKFIIERKKEKMLRY